MEEKQTHLVEFNDSGSDTKTLVADSVLESTKMSTKYVNVSRSRNTSESFYKTDN